MYKYVLIKLSYFLQINLMKINLFAELVLTVRKEGLLCELSWCKTAAYSLYFFCNGSSNEGN